MPDGWVSTHSSPVSMWGIRPVQSNAQARGFCRYCRANPLAPLYAYDCGHILTHIRMRADKVAVAPSSGPKKWWPLRKDRMPACQARTSREHPRTS